MKYLALILLCTSVTTMHAMLATKSLQRLQQLAARSINTSQRSLSSQSPNLQTLHEQIQACRAELQEMHKARQRIANVTAVAMWVGIGSYLYYEHDAKRNAQDDLPINITY